ncbi:hypothetical protein Taro_039934, partial [Colocasia esculenta]|nr:hypothetical protein [Colocasia esculenta]
MVGALPRLRRTSRGVRRGVSSRSQHPRAQALAPVPQEHGHGGPSIMERLVAFDHQTLNEALSAACRQESEMDQYIEEKRAAQN